MPTTIPPSETARSVPAGMSAARWARLAAHAVPLTVLPSGLWRVAMACGVPVGFSEEWLAAAGIPGWNWATFWPLTLTLLAECLALLTLGLVRPWGETVPRWVPVLGGRRIPPLAAILPAAVGAAILCAITTTGGVLWAMGVMGAPMDTPSAGWGVAIFAGCYAPLLAWGPLLAAVTVHYAHRRAASGPMPMRHRP